MANLPIIIVLLLIILAVYSNAYNSTASNFTITERKETPNNSTTSNSTKCLSSLNDVERELSSKIPPLEGLTSDNWRNISRALFPALKLPSLYVKVTLRFIKNQTVDEVKKFTWAESCAFVTDVSVDAATVFSLGTLWPQRRQTDLVLTVHHLCNKAKVVEENGFNDINEAWRYVLLTLQDIAIIPNVSDPRVNTAQCVVAGHEGDVDQPIALPDCYNWRGISIAIASILSTIGIYWFAKKFFDDPDNTLFSRKSCLALTIFCTIMIIVELVYMIFLITKNIRKSLGIFINIFSYIIFLIISFFNCEISCKSCKNCKNCRNCKNAKARCNQCWCEDCRKCCCRRCNNCCCKRCCKLFHIEVNHCMKLEDKCEYGECNCEKLPKWVYECHDKCNCEEQPRLELLGKGIKLLFACIYQVVYHLLWVLCGGIPADPQWAFPLFLCESVIALALFSAIYSCFENQEFIGRALFSVCATSVVIVVVVFSFDGSRVDDKIGHFLLIAIPAILVWFYKDARAFNNVLKTQELKK